MPIPPDQQVALANRLMRELLAPNLPHGIGATLILFPLATGSNPATGMVSYISSAQRADMRVALLRLLAQWDDEQDKKDGLFDEPSLVTPP